MSECLDIVADFLNAENQGPSKECLLSNEKYKDLKRYLKLQSLETPRLLQLYYQEMLSLQTSLKTAEYGQLFCRAYYHSKDETLVVEIFKCRNLVPMDQNGLSDPVREDKNYEFKIHFLSGFIIFQIQIEVCRGRNKATLSVSEL